VQFIVAGTSVSENQQQFICCTFNSAYPHQLQVPSSVILYKVSDINGHNQTKKKE
jgi:hypothetical protein